MSGRSGETLLDCARMLTELGSAGISNAEVARRLGVMPSTVQRWKSGSEPGYSMGVRLIDLHAYAVRNTPCATR